MKLFLDFDGTIVDVSSRHYRVYTEALAGVNGTPLTKAEYWQLKRNRVNWPDILTRSDVAEDLQPAFMEAFISLIENPEMLKLDLVIGDVFQTLKGLSAKHELFLVSLRRHQDRLEKQVTELGLAPYFMKIISGHTEYKGYDLKVEIISDLKTDESGVVVGDTETDVRAAQALSLISVAVVSGIREEEYLRSLNPDYVIDDMTQLPDILQKLA